MGGGDGRVRLEVEEMIDEELVRPNELEKVWWPLALGADKDATDRVLAI